MSCIGVLDDREVSYVDSNLSSFKLHARLWMSLHWRKLLCISCDIIKKMFGL